MLWNPIRAPCVLTSQNGLPPPPFIFCPQVSHQLRQPVTKFALTFLCNIKNSSCQELFCQHDSNREIVISQCGSALRKSSEPVCFLMCLCSVKLKFWDGIYFGQSGKQRFHINTIHITIQWWICRSCLVNWDSYHVVIVNITNATTPIHLSLFRNAKAETG